MIIGSVALAAAPGRTIGTNQQEDLVPLSPALNAETAYAPNSGLSSANVAAPSAREPYTGATKSLAKRPRNKPDQGSPIDAPLDVELSAQIESAGLDLRSAKFPATSSKSAQDLTYEKFKIRWPNDLESVDARHLLGIENTIFGKAISSGARFSLTPALLAQICNNNSFSPLSRDKAPCVLFGIRGALPDSDDSGWVATANLTLAIPNHFERRCTLGVWYRGTKRPEAIRVFPGSTVPNAHYMAEQAASSEAVSNLPPTGLHRYVVGSHRQEIDSAFRQSTPYPAHRLPHRTFQNPNLSELCYTNEVTPFSWPQLAAKLAIETVGVDIHPAFLDDDPIQFSSAGCQVIRGTQKQHISTGEQMAEGCWETFRTSAGLVDPPGNTQDGTKYDYLLISGREALLTASATTDQMPLLARFRFGSIDNGLPSSPFSAVGVREFQRALIVDCRKPGRLADRLAACALPSDFAQDGLFFGGTMRLVLAWQAESRGYADGIVDRDMLQSLKLL